MKYLFRQICQRRTSLQVLSKDEKIVKTVKIYNHKLDSYSVSGQESISSFPNWGTVIIMQIITQSEQWWRSMFFISFLAYLNS